MIDKIYNYLTNHGIVLWLVLTLSFFVAMLSILGFFYLIFIVPVWVAACIISFVGGAILATLILLDIP
jgi:hypothetical protein